jgi:hypothetical protein
MRTEYSITFSYEKEVYTVMAKNSTNINKTITSHLN